MPIAAAAQKLEKEMAKFGLPDYAKGEIRPDFSKARGLSCARSEVVLFVWNVFLCVWSPWGHMRRPTSR